MTGVGQKRKSMPCTSPSAVHATADLREACASPRIGKEHAVNAVVSAAAVASEVLRRERIGAVALLTLNRPAARNALSHALLAELTGALATIGGDAAIRAVV